MVRVTALRLFRREYMHGVRNGLKSREAADQAVTRVKAMVHKVLEARSDLSELDKLDRWGQILEMLVEFQIMLTGVPIDFTKLEEIDPKDQEAMEADIKLLIEDLNAPLPSVEDTKD